uniref:Uncharacterized protein AlNc14C111G6414 n=1 Tax=Albugo laibachii Nc14 TaxID=890382 RepID=F0WIL4_9STRA|nr:conserved hypothetical protein [Albugo laibachii Nc14]|eukprot:CCA21098.1 conserved hypothetical protein [Albugo laibachii Nc14]
MNSFAALSLERNQSTLCTTNATKRSGDKGTRVRRFSDIPVSRRSLDDTVELNDNYSDAEKKGDQTEMDDKLDDDSRICLLKPMPKLQVCPADDLVLEEEKRRRRFQKRTSGRKDAFNSIHFESSLGSVPKIGRDGMTIRHQYWSQLGINPTRRELERSSKRWMQRRNGLKVTLNDVEKARKRDRSIFDLFVNWYSSNGKDENRSKDNERLNPVDTKVSNKIVPAGTQFGSKDRHITPQTQDSTTSESNHPEQVKASVRFNHEAELFYIPIHREYSKHQRNCIWHTREEFITMVERNLESLYEELELEESEKKVSADEDFSHDDDLESKEATISESGVSDEADQPSVTVHPTSVNSGNVEMDKKVMTSLVFIPNDAHVKVAARARSSHDIRFKYLKHLGIDT